MAASNNNIRLVDRTMAVMSFLAHKAADASASEIASATGLSPATVYRILTTLSEHKAVTRAAKGHYQIGPRVLSWAQAYDRKAGITKTAELLMEGLWRECGETVNLFCLEGWRLYIAKLLRSPQPISTSCRVGTLVTLHVSSAGRAVLSWHSDREIRDYLDTTPLVALTPKTTVDRDRLWAKIMEARALGYGEENEEGEEGIRCVGSAVLDLDNRPIGAVSVTSPAFRMDDARARELGPKVREIARKISLDMGWVTT